MTAPQQEERLDGIAIVDLSIRQPVFITMLVVLTLVLGGLAYVTLPVDLLPDINPGTMAVTIAYPGASPDTVADQVAKPVEDALSTMNGVDQITSTSSENVAVISVQFTDGIEIEQALQDAREKIAGIRAQLPQDIEEPVYQRLDPAQSPILTLAIRSTGGQDSRSVRKALEDQVVPRLQTIPGVGSTTLTGGDERQINVLLDLRALQARGIAPAQVSKVIAEANVSRGLGSTRVGEQEWSLRAPSVFKTPQDIAQVGVGSAEVGDVAVIEDGVAEREVITRLDGAEAITLAVRKQSGQNTTAVAEAVKERLEEVFAQNPDLTYVIVADEAETVREQVNGSLEEMLIAVLCAIAVVWLFFRDVRNTLVSVMGLPVIIVGTFAVMSALGITLNILSLLALTVSVGLVIDDAIVVRENIFRHMERGEVPRVAASRATAQVAFSVLAMTLCVIAVFAPAGFTSGVTGTLFRTFGFTVAAAMLLSLAEAFTLAPMISALWFERQPPRPLHIKPGEEHLPHEAHEELGALERRYERLVRWTQGHRWLTIGAVVIVTTAGIVAASGVKVNFLPQKSAPELGVGFTLPAGTPLEESDRRARAVEAILSADPDVEHVLTTVGEGGSEQVEFSLRLREHTPSAEVMERLRPQLGDLPDLVFATANLTFGTNTSVTARPIQLRIRGAGENDDLAPIARDIVERIRDVPGFADVTMTYQPGKPELRYELRQRVANDYGFTNAELATTMRTLIDGNTATQYREAGSDYDIVVRLRPEDRVSFDELRRLRIPLGDTDVPLDTLADIETGSGPTAIRRVDRQSEILIGGNNVGRNVNDVIADIQERVDQVTLPAGVTTEWAGDAETQSDGFAAILVALALSILFVYMVLASQFGSFTQPLVIMLAMPLSVVGALLALRIAGVEISILVMIGLLMLMGLVVKNSILLVDFTNTLRSAGMTLDEAIIRASAVRLRPILMTSAAIISGNIPAAIGFGEGVELRRGTAVLLLGGVLSSTLLTLVLVPVAYSLFESFLARLRRPDQQEHASQPEPTTVS